MGESQLGPISNEEMHKLALNGDLSRSTKLMSPTNTKGKWTTLEHVPALLSALEKGASKRKEEALKKKSEENVARLKKKAEDKAARAKRKAEQVQQKIARADEARKRPVVPKPAPLVSDNRVLRWCIRALEVYATMYVVGGLILSALFSILVGLRVGMTLWSDANLVFVIFAAIFATMMVMAFLTAAIWLSAAMVAIAISVERNCRRIAASQDGRHL